MRRPSPGQLLTRPILIAVVTVACSSPAADAPEITPDTEASISANAVVRACGSECAQFAIYVKDELHDHQSAPGQTVPMSELLRRAIGDDLGEVTFVDQPGADALFGEGALVDGGEGILISVGPVRELAAGVVGIEVGVTTARDGGRGEIHQFQWDGGSWQPATAEDTGVTVTSWVS